MVHWTYLLQPIQCIDLYNFIVSNGQKLPLRPIGCKDFQKLWYLNSQVAVLLDEILSHSDLSASLHSQHWEHISPHRPCSIQLPRGTRGPQLEVTTVSNNHLMYSKCTPAKTIHSYRVIKVSPNSSKAGTTWPKVSKFSLTQRRYTHQMCMLIP